MVRTQVQLTENQAQLLKKLAAQENQSVAEVIRQAIDLWLANNMKATSNLVEKRRRARLA
jgi:Arc/MetJ-type ribon-helix-helix transcriptional regulator